MDIVCYFGYENFGVLCDRWSGILIDEYGVMISLLQFKGICLVLKGPWRIVYYKLFPLHRNTATALLPSNERIARSLEELYMLPSFFGLVVQGREEKSPLLYV